jgi:hypothetical protein
VFEAAESSVLNVPVLAWTMVRVAACQTAKALSAAHFINGLPRVPRFPRRPAVCPLFVSRFHYTLTSEVNKNIK